MRELILAPFALALTVAAASIAITIAIGAYFFDQF